MILPSLSTLLAAFIFGAIGVALVLLVIGIRGTVPDPTAGPGLGARLGTAVRSPALTSRVAAGVIVGALTLLVTRWPVAAVGLGVLVVFWPQLFGGTRNEQLQIARLEALVIWTEALRDTMSAHASLEQAIPATTTNAPILIRAPLIRLAGQIRAKVPMEKALLSLAAFLDDASADLILAALILNVRRRGDGLGTVLSNLAEAAREELEMRRRVSAGRAGLRRGVQIVVIITIGFAAFLAIFSAQYVAPYRTFGGQVALVFVFAFFGAGFAWMRQLSGAEPVMPFLARPDRKIDPEDLRLVARLTGLSTAAAEAIASEPQEERFRTGRPR
ncbi:MAG: type II secretion system protein [Actinomycetota bacterium]|nr:type II secretion system protein [Actinomycetota bacterium]MDQ2957642.1 type II secretion system protein [Actinomycetota bacterium]